MAPPDRAVEHYRRQAKQAEATAILTRRQWRRMTVEDLEGSWAQIVGRLAVMVGSGMLGAAQDGAEYVPEVLNLDTEGEVAAQRFGQTASDGRPLDTLLYSAVVRTKIGLRRGLTAPQALTAGGAWLDTLARTQVADAGRGAAGVAIAATPTAGYTRLVSPPCCQRCAVLAGKFFQWNTGFLRHPKCLCRHTACTQGQARNSSSVIGPGQVKDLTQAQCDAIADGADLNQVINSNRGRSSDGMTTSEGTTRRGLAGQRRPGAVRLTPDAIYRVSATRDQALELLRANGYLL